MLRPPGVWDVPAASQENAQPENTSSGLASNDDAIESASPSGGAMAASSHAGPSGGGADKEEEEVIDWDSADPPPPPASGGGGVPAASDWQQIIGDDRNIRITRTSPSTLPLTPSQIRWQNQAAAAQEAQASASSQDSPEKLRTAEEGEKPRGRSTQPVGCSSSAGNRTWSPWFARPEQRRTSWATAAEPYNVVSTQPVGCSSSATADAGDVFWQVDLGAQGWRNVAPHWNEALEDAIAKGVTEVTMKHEWVSKKGNAQTTEYLINVDKKIQMNPDSHTTRRMQRLRIVDG